MKRIFHSSILAFSAVFVLAMQPAYGEMPPAPMIWVMKTDSLGDSLWLRFYEAELSLLSRSYVHSTSDGGVIIIATHRDKELVGSLYLLKLDSQLDSVWSRIYEREDGGVDYYYEKITKRKKVVDSFPLPVTKNITGQAIVEMPDKGYLILGELYTDSVPYAPDIAGAFYDSLILIKTDSLGNTIWTQTPDWGIGKDIHPPFGLYRTSSDYYIVRLSSSSPLDPQFVKLDSLGNIIAIQVYDGFHMAGSYETPDQGFLFSAHKDSLLIDSAGHTQKQYVPAFIKTDSMGNILEEYAYQDSTINTKTPTGESYIWILVGNDSFGISKTDAKGRTFWQHLYPDTKDTERHSIQSTSDGGWVLCGLRIMSELRGPKMLPFLLKIDPNGSMLWHKTYTLQTSSLEAGVVQTSDGGYVVVGCTLMTKE